MTSLPSTPPSAEGLAAITKAPRVEACIEAVIKRHHGLSVRAKGEYFEAVHQELAPLARDLEVQLADALDDVQRLHNEKMKFFERTIELERQLAAALKPVSETAPTVALAHKLNELDAARYRYIRSNVQVKDRMVGYCVRDFVYETTCDKRSLDDAVDAAMHPERT